MWPYLVFFAVFALAAIATPGRIPGRLTWSLGMVAMAVFTGLRHKVGMDWNNYLGIAQYMEAVDLLKALNRTEPGYAILLWSSTALGFGVYGANLIGNAIFTAGLFRFAKTTSAPWMAIVIAIPMLVVVISMSANRQTVAIGVLMWLIAVWSRAGVVKRIALVALAASFHYSAAFFFIFIALDMKMRTSYKLLLAVVSFACAFAFMQISGAVDTYDSSYLDSQGARTFSPGATQHVLLNGIPGLAVLLGRRLRVRLLPNQVATQMAWLSVFLIPMAFIYSVPAGRMTMYLFPVSMLVIGNLTEVIVQARARLLVRTFTCSIMFGILWFWLNFANSSSAHIPYGNALFVESWRLAL